MRRATAELIVKDPNKFAHHDRVFLNNPVVMHPTLLARASVPDIIPVIGKAFLIWDAALRPILSTDVTDNGTIRI